MSDEIRRTWIAEALLKEHTAQIATGIFMLLLDYSIGYIVTLIDSLYLHYDLPQTVFYLLDYYPWWRNFRPISNTYTKTHGVQLAVLLCNRFSSQTIDILVIGTLLIGINVLCPIYSFFFTHPLNFSFFISF